MWCSFTHRYGVNTTLLTNLFEAKLCSSVDLVCDPIRRLIAGLHVKLPIFSGGVAPLKSKVQSLC